MRSCNFLCDSLHPKIQRPISHRFCDVAFTVNFLRNGPPVYFKIPLHKWLRTRAWVRKPRRAAGHAHAKVYTKHSTELCKTFLLSSYSKCSAAHPNIAIWGNMSVIHKQNLAGMFLKTLYTVAHLYGTQIHGQPVLKVGLFRGSARLKGWPI